MKKTFFFLAAFAVAATPSAFAAGPVWSGTADGNWDNASNWGGVLPVPGDIANFKGVVANSTVSLNGAAISVATINFDIGSGNVLAGPYIFNADGGTLTLSSGINFGSGVAANTTETFNATVNLLTNDITLSTTGATSSLNLAGGVNNLSVSARTATFKGAGQGGVVNGLTQSGGGALAVTFSHTAGGVWEITGANTATGLLTISGVGGVTRLSSDFSTASGTVLGGWLQINNTLPNGGLSSGGFSQTGTLEAYGADRTINTATHTLAGSPTFVGSYSLTISSEVTFTAGGGTIVNNISGNGKALTFDNTSFYLQSSDAAATRTFDGTGVTVVKSNIINNASANTKGANILKIGEGKLILSGNNSYTGGTIISAGILQLDSANALGAGYLKISGGILGLGAGDFTRALATSGAGKMGWTDSGGFAAYGADRLVNIGGASVAINWNAPGFLHDGQTLVFGASDSTHKVTYQNPLGLTDAARTIQVNDGVSATNVDAEISGVISSATPALGSLVKTGSGTLSLSGVNTYTGLTTVSEGRLLVKGSLGGGASVAAGAALGGAGTIAGATTIGGSLLPGNNNSIGTLTVQNDVTWNAGNAWVFELGSAAASLALADAGSSSQDLLNLTGAGSDFLKGSGSGWTFDFAGTGASGWYKIVDWTGSTTFAFSDFSAINLGGGLTGAFTVDAATSALYFNVVPEPGTWKLLTLSLAGLLFFTRRRIA